MKALLLAGAAASGVMAGAALAKEADGDGEIVLASLDEITVYATRQPMPAFDYPGQVSVIDRDAIFDFDPSKISDIFDAIPGARFDGGPRRNGEVPSVRGLSGAGVLILFDGARQSFLSGHDGRFFIDPEVVRAVEVVRGPTSALYGSGALGGVIALRTIEAGDMLGEGETIGLSVGSGYQSVNDEWRVTGTGAIRSADGKAELVGNVTWRKSEDIDLGSGFVLPADDEIVSSLVKGTVRPTDALSLSATWIRYSGDSIDPNNPQGNNVAGSGNGDVDRDISSDTAQLRLNYNPENSDLIDLDVTTYFARNDVTEAELDSTRIVSRKVDSIGVSINNSSHFSLAPGANLTFTYGGEFYRDEQDGADNMSVDGTRGGVPNATAKFYGAYIQGELALENPLGAPGVLTVIPGVRWDKFKNEATGEASTDDEAISPKVGVSYKPVKEFIIFGNWAEAFRAPSVNEIYADNVHFQIPDFTSPTFALVTNFFIPNPDLVPEESQSWEVGAGFDFDSVFFEGDRLTAKGSYYEADVTNLIDLEVNIPAGCFGAPFPPCGSGEAFGNFSRNVNVHDADLNGVEIEAQYDSRYFYARANFATIDGKDVATGDYVGVLSPDMFFVDAGVKFPPADLRLGARVSIASDFTKVDDVTEERDGYSVGDIYAVWEPSAKALKGFRLNLGVDNVTDADYEVVAAGVSQPGRNFKAAVRWRKAF